ncbi:MAG: insulinase family protein [Ruminococcus sp.]|nr:insulinase family protein [Ruminococcus sp.]
MNINDHIHGFTVKDIRNTEESGTQLVEMTHDKTGARLAWMKNGNENKLFSIAFKTVPEDDTGVFHILEHSVLCGSEKYPVKEPFLDLLKSSMNTFLNAMTFPDKTMYPVSSRNDTDFMNLTKVYLDAVFRPSIYTNPSIFAQEGWHIEMRDKADTPLYKGVVFNEMKGALSSVDNRIESELLAALYPDSCYRFESGGDPVHIPDLTYEQFLEDHRRFYHPSNSYIYLDGDVDIDALLELMDSEYLSSYSRMEKLPEIAFQKQTAPVEKKFRYGIAPGEPSEKRTHLIIGKVLGSFEDREKFYAAKAVAEAVAGTNDSPLARTLLDTGMCLDVSMSVEGDVMQPFGSLVISNTDEENCPELLAAVKKCISDIVKNGIDREMLSAAINRMEFRHLLPEEPAGLDRAISAMSSWLYGGDVLHYIDCGEVFASLREKLDTDYYEKLLEEWLLDENGRAVLYAIPSDTYDEKLRTDEERRISERVAAMDEDGINDIIAKNKKLDIWQQTEDSPEQKATLPVLPLSEVSKEPFAVSTKVTESDDIKLLYHTSSVGAITGLNYYFDISDLPQDMYVYARLLTELLAELPTKKSTGEEMQKKITGLLGSLSIRIKMFTKLGESDKCRIFLAVSTQFLDKNREEALDLVSEILNETVFDKRDLILENIRQEDEDIRQAMIGSGHAYARRRAAAGLSSEGTAGELFYGITAYRRIHELASADDAQTDELISKLKEIASKYICRERLTVSCTSSSPMPAKLFAERFPHGETCTVDAATVVCDIPEKTGLVIPSGVSYAAAALSKPEDDRPVWNLLSSVLTYEFLWGEVRVKGGAYGTGFTGDSVGVQMMHTYRDPSPDGSIEIFRRSADFLREYCAGKPVLDNYIISTIASGEPLINDIDKGSIADVFYFKGMTDEVRLARRSRLLSLKAEDLAEKADELEKIGHICVIGAEKAVEACRSDDMTMISLG